MNPSTKAAKPPHRRCGLMLYGMLGFGLLSVPLLEAGTQILPYPPVPFFTNVAGRLLKSQLHLDLNQIQVYPTNQYTPAVHRLLQVAANLYDSTTNRCFQGPCSAPYRPSVFRPLFRRKDTPSGPQVFIVGYREVSGTALAEPVLGPRMVYLEDGMDKALLIPPIGSLTQPMERAEPLVGGIPLVLGARKCFPNFNEFAMQTGVLVSRLIEFRRTSLNGPVTLTNQMYTLMLSNIFGVEAWNSYSNAYPRSLQLLATISLTTVITNIDGTGQSHVILSNRWSEGISTNIAAGDWPGWTALSQAPASFVLPFGSTSTSIVTNASYLDQPPFLLPLTHVFFQQTGFYYPRWWLSLNVRLRFVLVDTDAQRIVDYVNLDRWEPPLDITAKLAEGADCTGNPSSLGNPAVQWCTNRAGGAIDPLGPTIGLKNQIGVGLGIGNVNLGSFTLDSYAGRDAESAIDGFR
ncbi:MAG: hypothetical protein ACREP9_01915, partial [Candidatus Dormibacteraceae bacterium]